MYAIRSYYGSLVDLEIVLRLPDLAAVFGAEDGAGLADGPAVLRIAHGDRVEQTLGSAGPLLPRPPPVFGAVDGAVVARGDDALIVDHRDREEIVEDVDLALGVAGGIVEVVAPP